MAWTKAVGRKFDPEGGALPFPGNTVICAVDPATPVFAALVGARDLLRSRLGRIGQYAFLPPASYHMTVFDCVCAPVRRPEVWTRLLPLEAPLEDVDARLAELFSKVPVPPPFEMVFERTILGDWLAAGLVPASPAEESRIRGFRDELSGRFGIRHPGHETYRFHITLAYGITEIEPHDRTTLTEAGGAVDDLLRWRFGTFRAVAPYFSCFTDMLSFPRSRGG